MGRETWTGREEPDEVQAWGSYAWGGANTHQCRSGAELLERSSAERIWGSQQCCPGGQDGSLGGTAQSEASRVKRAVVSAVSLIRSASHRIHPNSAPCRGTASKAATLALRIGFLCSGSRQQSEQLRWDPLRVLSAWKVYWLQDGSNSAARKELPTPEGRGKKMEMFWESFWPCQQLCYQQVSVVPQEDEKSPKRGRGQLPRM